LAEFLRCWVIRQPDARTIRGADPEIKISLPVDEIALNVRRQFVGHYSHPMIGNIAAIIGQSVNGRIFRNQQAAMPT
jgi:hypothetical protein